jgi:hypothetical protein
MSENLGFLTVIDQTPGGLTGGFLVLNRAGRPLEFHCTMPIQPEKIQKILYGDALQPFLCGERIAQTLIQRSKLPVFSILTNQPAVLPVQPLVSTPIVYIFGDHARQEASNSPPSDSEIVLPPAREISEELNESLKTFGIDNTNLRTKTAGLDESPQMPNVPGFDTGQWKEVRVGNRLIAIPEMEPTTGEQLVAGIKEMARTIDLLEPFTRIRLALDEAKNVA